MRSAAGWLYCGWHHAVTFYTHYESRDKHRIIGLVITTTDYDCPNCAGYILLPLVRTALSSRLQNAHRIDGQGHVPAAKQVWQYWLGFSHLQYHDFTYLFMIYIAKYYYYFSCPHTQANHGSTRAEHIVSTYMRGSGRISRMGRERGHSYHDLPLSESAETVVRNWKWNEHRVFTLLFSNSVQRTRQGVTLLPSGPPFNVLIRGTRAQIQPLFTSPTVEWGVGRWHRRQNSALDVRHICLHSCGKIS